MTSSLLNPESLRSRSEGVTTAGLFALTVAYIGMLVVSSYLSTWASLGIGWVASGAAILAVLGEGFVWIGMWAQGDRPCKAGRVAGALFVALAGDGLSCVYLSDRWRPQFALLVVVVGLVWATPRFRALVGVETPSRA